MRINTLLLLGAVIGAVGIPFASLAKDEPALPDVTVSDLTVAGVIGGETIDAESLKGKVVAVEYWGQH